MQFFLPQDTLSIALMAVAVVAALWIIFNYCSMIRSVEPCEPYTDGSKPLEEPMPKISIIVYDKESSRALNRLLTAIFDQDYPGDYEIIVVSDGKSSHTADVVNQLQADHHNLHLTFVPDEAHALSRKKLAIALGIKAAKYPLVILTESDMLPSSEKWLTTMARHFAAGSTLVIGFASPRERNGHRTSAMARFDILADAVTYLSRAVKGEPYRGSASCLGFERRLILDHKGLTNSVGLHNGEDDIIVSTMAPHARPSVAIEEDALVTLQCPDFYTQHRLSKLRHNFTAGMVYRGARRRMAAASAMMWAWIAATVACFCLCKPNMLPGVIAAVAGLAWIVAATLAWVKASRVLGIRVNFLALPLLMIFRPFYNFVYLLRARSYRRRNFTWAKP